VGAGAAAAAAAAAASNARPARGNGQRPPHLTCCAPSHLTAPRRLLWQRGIQEDAAAALKVLQAHKAINGERIVVFGRSLGGAVAMHLAAQHGDQVGGEHARGGPPPPLYF